VIGHWSLVLLPALAFAWVVSFAVTAGLVAWQGRLMFPALPALAILLARGLAGGVETGIGGDIKAHRGPRAAFSATRRTLALVGVSLVLGAIAIWVPVGVIRPAYPLHTLPEAVALERLGTPVYGRLGVPGERGAELRGWRLEGQARPGATPELVLMWHALARQNRDWVVFVHLVEGEEQVVAEDNRQPRDGAFPMTQWVAGDWVEDRHPLSLPPQLAPGAYTLRVGLYDPRGRNRRTSVYDARDRLRGDYLELGSITVTSDK
jgi:hypothetical protein